MSRSSVAATIWPHTASKVYAALGLLAGVAGAAVAAGAAVNNPIFWSVAAAVFFMAMTGLVAYAAKSLGVFAELAELIRLRAERQTR